ncbi:hypothetical protein PybrP1_006339 [[Pythium] brassicae (nom. inval.)]|nr:hypothetical protein PybrP1_006339 [[Pythium] brassicae (nom. inval.)]
MQHRCEGIWRDASKGHAAKQLLRPQHEALLRLQAYCEVMGERHGVAGTCGLACPSVREHARSFRGTWAESKQIIGAKHARLAKEALSKFCSAAMWTKLTVPTSGYAANFEEAVGYVARDAMLNIAMIHFACHQMRYSPFLCQWHKDRGDKRAFPVVIEKRILQPQEKDGTCCGVMVLAQIYSHLRRLDRFQQHVIDPQYIRVLRLRVVWMLMCRSTQHHSRPDSKTHTAVTTYFMTEQVV